MKVASDNTSATAFASFSSGIQQYGIPERVRTDKGLENIQIAEFMLAIHGTSSKSHITGRSVHNQRYYNLVLVLEYFELFQIRKKQHYKTDV